MLELVTTTGTDRAERIAALSVSSLGWAIRMIPRILIAAHPLDHSFLLEELEGKRAPFPRAGGYTDRQLEEVSGWRVTQWVAGDGARWTGLYLLGCDLAAAWFQRRRSIHKGIDYLSWIGDHMKPPPMTWGFPDSDCPQGDGGP